MRAGLSDWFSWTSSGSGDRPHARVRRCDAASPFAVEAGKVGVAVTDTLFLIERLSTVTEWASNLDLVAVRERSLALGANEEPVPGERLGTCVLRPVCQIRGQTMNVTNKYHLLQRNAASI